MGSLTESFYDTMAQFMDAVPAGTTVIKATIVERTDEAKNEYTVKYLSNKLTAYANSETVYQADSEVYILVPDGNLKETLIILAGVDPEATAAASATTDYTYEVSNNYILNTEWIKLDTSKTVNKEYPIGENNTTTVSNSIKELYYEDFKTYHKLKLSCKIKTAIDKDKQVQGNYGLILSIPVINTKDNTSDVLTYTYDINNINGNPYNLTSDTLQEFIIDIPTYYEANGYFTLDYFCKNFPATSTESTTTTTGFFGDISNEEKVGGLDNIVRNPDYLDLSSIKSIEDIDVSTANGFSFGSSQSGNTYALGNTDYSLLSTGDILIKDVSLYVITELTKEQRSGYYLRLEATQGNRFLNGSYKTTKTITPIFYIDGKQTKISKSYQLYWFEENPKILPSSEGYVNYGGSGWYCLNTRKATSASTTDETQSITYITNPVDLEVTRDDVLSKKSYKAVLIYHDEAVAGTIDIEDKLDNAYTFTVEADRSTYPNGIGNVNVTATFEADADTGSTDKILDGGSVIFYWTRYTDSGELITDTPTITAITKTDYTYSETIQFSAASILYDNYVQCAIYSTTEDNESHAFLTSKKIKISTTEDTAFTINVLNDNVLYKYDSEGDSPAEDYYDGPVSSKITDILPINYNLYTKEGIEFSKEEYKLCKTTWKIHKDSLLISKDMEVTPTEDDDYYYYTYTNLETIKPLGYEIESEFERNKALNNNYYLIIEYDGNKVETTINIEFLKDGDSGTNGTKYSALLGWVPSSGYSGDERFFPYGKVDDKSNGLERKLKILVDNSNKVYYYSSEQPIAGTAAPQQFEQQYFTVHVYKDGNKLTANTDYTVSYKFFDTSVTMNGGNQLFNIGESTGILTASGKTNDKWIDQCYIIQATISITDSDSGTSDLYSGTESTIYCYYPIDFITISKTISSGEKISTFPSIEGGFDTVVYDKSGENPDYNNRELVCNFSTIADEAFPEGNPFNGASSVDWIAQNHINISGTGDTATATPHQKYDSGNTLNYIKATINSTKVNSLYSQYKTKIDTKAKLCNCLDVIDSYMEGSTSIDSIVTLVTTEMKALQKAISEYKKISKWYWINGEFYNTCSSSISKFKSAISKYKSNGYISISSADTFQSTIDSYKKDGYLTDNEDTMMGNMKTFIAYNDTLSKTFDSCLSIIYSLISNYNNDTFQDKDKTIYRCINEVDSETNDKIQEQITKLKTYLDPIFNFADDNTMSISSKYTTVCEANKDKYSAWSNLVKVAIDTETITLNNQKSTQYDVTYIKPVVFLFNRYELSWLNGWDGNKLVLNDSSSGGTGTSYIAAPMVAAGEKENGLFSGMWMGVERRNTSNSELAKKRRIGLFGFDQGIQSVFINAENGSATFGKPFNESSSSTTRAGGQIIIDPSKDAALLYSSNFFSGDAFEDSYGSNYGLLKDGAYTAVSNLASTDDGVTVKTPSGTYFNNDSTTTEKGMLIDLSTPFITFGNGKFSVGPNGALKSTSGEIGGWVIGEHDLKSQNGYLTLSSSGQGTVYSNTHSSLTNTSNGFYLSDDGLSIGSKFKISSDGIAYIGYKAVDGSSSTHWAIDGNSDKSYMGYNTSSLGYWIDAQAKYYNEKDNSSSGEVGSNQVYVGTDGIRIGTAFRVDTNGKLEIGNINSTSGWKIKSNGSDSYIAYNTTSFSDTNGLYFGTSGIRLGSTFNVTSGGYLTASSGKIGDWTISNGSLTSGNVTISSGGDIYQSTDGGTTKGWEITSTGSAVFHNITADYGTIGGWNITSGNLNNGSIYLNSSGTITGSGYTMSGSGVSYTGAGSCSYSGADTVSFNNSSSDSDAYSFGYLKATTGATINHLYLPDAAGKISFGTEGRSQGGTGTVCFNNNTYLVFKSGICVGACDKDGNGFPE